MKRVFLIIFVLSVALTGFAKQDPTKIPVLMVHGYFLPGAETWLVLKNRIIKAGWSKDYVMNPTFKNVVGCNPKHGEEIAKWVDELKARTGADKVDFVTHSMGALDVRYYIKDMCGYRNVNKVVTIAGANHGTTVACVDIISCGAAEMCRKKDDWQSNDFLKAINACDETPGDILYTSIWSPYDEIIRPPESSILNGAENIQIQAKLIGHGGILALPETGDKVVYALKQGGRNYNGPGWECLKCGNQSENASERLEDAYTDATEMVPDASIDEESTNMDGAGSDESEAMDGENLALGTDFNAETVSEISDTGKKSGDVVKDNAMDTDKWQRARVVDDQPPSSPAGGCDQGTGPGAGAKTGLVFLVLILMIVLKRRGLAVILVIFSLHGMAKPINRAAMLNDINPAVRAVAARRLKNAPVYHMKVSTVAGKPYEYTANMDVVFSRPGTESKVLFYLYGEHPDIKKQGGAILISHVRVCDKEVKVKKNGPNLWVPLKACKSRKKINIRMDFTGRLAKIQQDRTTLAGELLREAGDMLSGSPSFELSFGAFAFGQGFYNYFGFYPLLASFQAGQGGWIEMKSNVLGDAPEPDAAFYDVSLITPGAMVAAIPGQIVSSMRRNGVQRTRVHAAGFRYFAFAFGDFDRLQSKSGDVDIDVYVKKGLINEGAALLDTATHAIAFFQKHIHAYPNRRFLVVESPLSMGVAGLEASGLVYISSMMVESPKGTLGRLFGPGLRQILPFVVAHETAHEWWAHLVGNSTWKAPFLDEALANEYALYFLEQQKGPEYCTNLCGNIMATYAMVRSIGSKDAPVSTPSSAFGNDIYGYLGVVYAKGGYMMELIRHSIGNAIFDSRMQKYAGRFAFSKASSNDLEAFLASSGVAAKIYKRFVYGTTGDREICPPGLLFLSMCMNNCMSGCLQSPAKFWKDRMQTPD